MEVVADGFARQKLFRFAIRQWDLQKGHFGRHKMGAKVAVS